MTGFVMLACNNPDNGAPQGYAPLMEIEVPAGKVELMANDEHGPVCRILDGQRVRLGRYVYPFERHSSWVGNWCWDGFVMSLETVRKLAADQLQKTDWWMCMGVEANSKKRMRKLEHGLI